MTDINDWIKERRTVHAAATEGPWEVVPFREGDYGEYCEVKVRTTADIPVRHDDDRDVLGYDYEDYHSTVAPRDARATVDAHNTFPTVLTALERVLELHQAVPEPGVGYLDDGTYGDIDPSCGACGTYDEYATPWPCATVRAIEGAIND